LACSRLLPVDPALPWNTLSAQASAQRTQSEAEAENRGGKEHRSKEQGNAPEMKGDAEASPARRAAVKRSSKNPRPAAIARASLRPGARASARCCCCCCCCDSPELGTPLRLVGSRPPVVDGAGGGEERRGCEPTCAPRRSSLVPVSSVAACLQLQLISGARRMLRAGTGRGKERTTRPRGRVLFGVYR
jgi:hypothetical protein